MTTRHRGDVQDFADLAEATAWLDAHGYVYGSMQATAPIGVQPASLFEGVSKWRRLSAAQRRACVAVLTVQPAPDGQALRVWERPWRLTWQHAHKEATP